MFDKLRVLHIITRLDAGGSAINTLETVVRLDKSVYDVDLVSGRTLDPGEEIMDFIRRKEVSCVFINDLVREIHPWKDVIAFFRLRAFIKRGQYDVVHTHSSKAGILGRWAAWSCGVKKIVHTPHGHVFYGYFSKPVSLVFVWIERLTARITTRLVALTEKGIEEHVALGVGRRDQWVAIPSGIDLAVFFPSASARESVRRQWDVGDTDVIVMSVSRLDPVKNASTLIEAFALLARDNTTARLFFVGDGIERQKLGDLVAARGLEGRVVFAGFRRDAPAVFNAADIFVLASFNEGMGRAALEAMATGLPVIVSRTGGLVAIVNDGQEGLLVSPENVEAWAMAMRTMVTSSELRCRMGEAGRRCVGARFSIETMVSRIAEVYAHL